MADFISDLSSNLGDKVLPNGDALNRKIDFQRDKFLKGISSTKHGKKEDPTYLHFKFIFDFGNNSLIDPETFLAPSPLFRSYDDRNYNDVSNDITARAAAAAAARGESDERNPLDINAVLSQLEKNVNNGFQTDEDFFYGSKSKIDGRAGIGFFPTGEVAYMGAQQFLYQRSVKRQQMLEAFKRGIDFINKECPYYFQTLSGLDTLLKKDILNYHKQAGQPRRAGTLTIDCLESIDMRMFSLSELYRKAVYDFTYHRIMLPENLRKFRMWLVITELRNIQLTYGINDILNPFSIPSVAQAANFADSFNSQTGLLNNAQGLLQKSTNTEQPGSDRFGTYTMGPYAFVYQLDQCEFDFDDSFPSYSSIDNKGGPAVSSKFKIHVGRVKDYKIQFNQLADVIKKDDNIQQMVLSDIWGGRGASYNDYDYTGTQGLAPVDLSNSSNPSEFFAQIASNFINNTVADLKNQGVSIVQGELLGNIYGLGGINPTQAASSVQSLVSTIKGGVPNPFQDNTPQAQGFGGPTERQYPTVNFDVYPNNPSAQSENLGNVITNTPGNNSLSSDVYGNTPGADLGLPERQYPSVSTDEYSNVPGPDLGIPGRVYPQPNTDLYSDVPGSDLGLPDRQYTSVNDDQYSGVPGGDLGIPGRIYPEVNTDLYSDVPGSDLGLPDRQYGAPKGDEYSGVPGEDLGAPDRVYTEPKGDQYSDVPGSDLGLPDRQYAPPPPKDEYPGVPGEDLGVLGRVYDEPKGDVYDQVPGSDLGLSTREYKTPPPKDEYPGVPGNDLGAPLRVYKAPDGETDSYQNVPGSDLGLRDREYPNVFGKEYEFPLKEEENLGKVYEVPRGAQGGSLDENKLAGDDSNYNNLAGASYDQILPNRNLEDVGSKNSENTFIGDIYNGVPGSELGLPGRRYPNTIGRVYSKPGQIDTNNLGRIYPTEE